ncbi:MAG: c-type cytochrome [Acidobacteriaceae bacterium]
MRRDFKIRVAAVAAAVLLCGAAVPGAAASREQRGAELFQKKGCLHCHTMDGVGGHKGPNLSGVGKRLKPAAIQKQILTGGLTMPSFDMALTADEVKDLVAYLHKCRKDIAPAAEAEVRGKSAE